MPAAHAEPGAEPASGPERPVAAALRCPRCGYDLSGPVPTWTESCPVSGVCTECGLAFDYRDVFEPLRDVPAWFFELARRRRVRAFVSTAVRTLRPARFWRDVKLSFPFRRFRLLVFAAGVLLAVYAFGVLVEFVFEGFVNRGLYRRAWNPTAGSWIMMGFDDTLIFPVLRNAAAWPGAPPLNVVPWYVYPRLESMWFVLLFVIATPAGFLCLGQSLGRAKVRGAHVWRAAVYAATPLVFWVGGVHLAEVCALWYWRQSSWNWGWANRGTPQPIGVAIAEWVMRHEWLLVAPMVPVTVVIWWIICRRYFRIDHAPGVAFAMTLIGLLATLLPLLFLTGCVDMYVLWFIG